MWASGLEIEVEGSVKTNHLKEFWYISWLSNDRCRNGVNTKSKSETKSVKIRDDSGMGATRPQNDQGTPT